MEEEMELTPEEQEMLREAEEFNSDSNTSNVTSTPSESTSREELMEEIMEEVLGHTSVETTESAPVPVNSVPALPENSPTLLVDETSSRFSSAVWYDLIQQQNITLAGLGGIGSYVAFLLSRVKVQHINLYDPDTVETVNMAGQLFSIYDVGKYKVDAVATLVSNYSDYYSTNSHRRVFDTSCLASNIMICGFDNMEARKNFFETWFNYVSIYSRRDQCLFIDGRLAAEEFQIFAIQGTDYRAIEEYRTKWLFSDAEADATICSYKQTSFCANMIASCMVNIFVNFIANQCDPLIPRDVPFLTEYDASTMYFKTKA